MIVPSLARARSRVLPLAPAAVLSVLAAVAMRGAPAASTPPAAAVDPASSPLALSAMAHLPLRFEENQGQVDESARFVARPRGATLVLTDEGATLALPRETALSLKVAGGRKVKPIASAPLATRSNYLIGKDRAKWHTDVPNFGRVVYPSVLDGVDLVYHGEEGQLEYDFVVAPGASASSISVEVAGASELSLTATGDLAIHTGRGELVQRKPRVFQHDASGSEQEIDASYRLVGAKTIAFEVAAYDRTRDLVIDPVIEYSTYIGGSATDSAFSLAVDGTGNAYITGSTGSTNFPTKAPFQAASNGFTDVFVAKLNNGGSALVYATYIGGTGDEQANGIIVDKAGNAHVVGLTDSTDFPMQNAVHPTSAGSTEAFALKLAPTGSSLVYSTYLGGSATDIATSVAVDATGNAYVSGSTSSTDFATVNPAQPANGGGAYDAFVAKLSSDGATVAYATYLGGDGEDTGLAIAIDPLGNAYVAGNTGGGTFPTKSPFQAASGGGRDGFIAKLTSDGSAVTYATYLGGTGDDSIASIAVDTAGNAYVAGQTKSSDFPTKTPLSAALAGATDAFVTKLNPAGLSLVYSTYLGGNDVDLATHITLDPAGSAYVVGATTSTNFPLMKAPQGVNAGGTSDAFATKLTAGGSALLYSTYLGGSGTDLATGIVVDAKGDTFLSGMTDSANFPKQAALSGTNAGTDAFMVRLISTTALAVAPTTVKVAPRGTFKFTATGGTATGYTFDIQTNASGAVMDPTGTYTAGTIRGVVDIVRVKDSAGATATAMATVDPSGVGAPDAGAVQPAGPGAPPPVSTPVDTSDPDAGCSVVASSSSSPFNALAVVSGVALGLALAARRRRRGA